MEIRNGDIGEDEKHREIKRIEPLIHPNPAKRPVTPEPEPQPERVPEPVKVPALPA